MNDPILKVAHKPLRQNVISLLPRKRHEFRNEYNSKIESWRFGIKSAILTEIIYRWHQFPYQIGTYFIDYQIMKSNIDLVKSEIKT